MPRGAGCPRGVPARLACLLLLALIAVVCLATGADAKKRPAACPTNDDGTPACNNCVKKNCRFDDRCIFDKSAVNSPSSPMAACETASTKVNPDVCRGIQRKHGKNAPAIVSATGTGGKAGKRVRCLASTSPQNNNTSVPCGCMTKKGKEAKRGCKFCVPKTPLAPCTDGVTPGTSQGLCPTTPGTAGDTPPPPPPGNVTAPPPPPGPLPGTDFVPGNVMTMQGGAIKYTPSTKRGNWTTLCQIPQQAKAIKFAATQKDANDNTIPDTTYILKVWEGTLPVPGLSALYGDTQTTYNSAVTNEVYNFMTGTTYFTNAAKWYTEGLPKKADGKSNGGIAPSTYTGTGADFLDSYFRSGIQATTTTVAPSGTSDVEANGQILQKTSAYWVAVTHVMYNLDMAETNLAANNTAAAQANFDSAAAAYYGCGDTNPVPLPLYTGSPITYSTTASDPDTGFNATTMSIYGVANKRADNYGTLGFVSTTGGTCTAASATCKKVAATNVAVGAALSGGPTTANIATIRDSTLTIFTQAAQRYAAKLSLGANLPGNGLGGSTNPTTVTGSTNPIAGSYIPSTIGGTDVDKKQPTACGGPTSYVFMGVTNPTDAFSASGKYQGCGIATQSGGATDGVGGGASCRKVSGVNACGVNGATQVSAAGTPATNTVTFEAVQAVISNAGTAVAPYVLKPAAEDATADNKGGGSTNAEITAATRGYITGGTTVDPNSAPIACVGPTVTFSEITSCGTANCAGGVDTKKGLGLKLCVPNGIIPPATVLAATTLTDRVTKYRGAAGAPGLTADKGPTTIGFWDPVTVSMATGGAFCCNALVYSDEGIGRKVQTGVVAPSEFVPPMSGGNMVAETTPGGMCNGGDTVTGLSVYKNPTMVNLLEGQAFYACMAPMQYTLQTTSTNTATQKVRADKQRICAETLTSMLKVSGSAATTSTCKGLSSCTSATATGTTTCVNVNKADGTAAGTDLTDTTKVCRGSLESAIDFPIWPVKIGGNFAGNGGKEYFVPSGYCYANACFEDFAEVGTQESFKGKTKLSALVKGPDMSSAPTSASAPSTSCGRANAACGVAPSTWTGSPAEFKKCAITNINGAGETTCSSSQIQAQTGRLPVA